MTATIELAGATVDFGRHRALDEIDLRVDAGEFVTLLGPSGSGKTTTLNAIAGFAPLAAGDVLVAGRSVSGLSPSRRALGIVFQSYALFPHMTVADNVGFPLRARKVARRERAHRVAKALELVQLGGFGQRKPATLSGGQQQRVALARAIVYEPQVLLLDEPLAALDKQLRESMQLELKRLQRSIGITTVAVTHDQTEAMALSDRVAIMRDGRIEQVASPSDAYAAPATRFVAEFLGAPHGDVGGRRRRTGPARADQPAHGADRRAAGDRAGGRVRRRALAPVGRTGRAATDRLPQQHRAHPGSRRHRVDRGARRHPHRARRAPRGPARERLALELRRRRRSLPTAAGVNASRATHRRRPEGRSATRAVRRSGPRRPAGAARRRPRPGRTRSRRRSPAAPRV
jgi:ABC-type Fe3+/spermidine/putrescine transport system ATPase subunit